MTGIGVVGWAADAGDALAGVALAAARLIPAPLGALPVRSFICEVLTLWCVERVCGAARCRGYVARAWPPAWPPATSKRSGSVASPSSRAFLEGVPRGLASPGLTNPVCRVALRFLDPVERADCRDLGSVRDSESPFRTAVAIAASVTGDVPPTRALSRRNDRLSADRFDAFGRFPGPLGAPADRRNVRPTLGRSQALKPQHLVVSCPAQPPHLGRVPISVEIPGYPVDRLRITCGRPVDRSTSHVHAAVPRRRAGGSRTRPVLPY